jgi:hypothetical protein
LAKVIFVDDGEWDQLDRINLDLTVAHAVPTARFRGSADRRQIGRPTIPPVDEFGREQTHDGE